MMMVQELDHCNLSSVWTIGTNLILEKRHLRSSYKVVLFGTSMNGSEGRAAGLQIRKKENIFMCVSHQFQSNLQSLKYF